MQISGIDPEVLFGYSGMSSLLKVNVLASSSFLLYSKTFHFRLLASADAFPFYPLACNLQKFSALPSGVPATGARRHLSSMWMGPTYLAHIPYLRGAFRLIYIAPQLAPNFLPNPPACLTATTSMPPAKSTVYVVLACTYLHISHLFAGDVGESL